MSNIGKRYTDEFKVNIVKLLQGGKPVKEIVSEFKVARSTVEKWNKDYESSNSFKAKDNRSESENEMIQLKKELKQLRMENDILKQAALILAQK